MFSVFSSKVRKDSDTGAHAAVVAAVRDVMNNAKTVHAPNNIGQLIALESIDASQSSTLSMAFEHFEGAFKRMAETLNIKPSKSQIDAAASAALLSSNITATVTGKVAVEGHSDKASTFVGMNGVLDGHSKRLPALEAYDERDNRNANVYMVAYSFLAGHQNELGETFFPTVVVPADNVGVAVSIRLVQVQDDIKRNVSGAVANFNRRNIVRALIDSTILKNEMTRIVPVHRAQSVGNFVASADVAPAPVLLEGESINTAPLAVGVELDLLGLSQTDALLASGTMGPTDSIDPAVSLNKIYVKVGADVLSFNVDGLALSNFIASPQDNYKRHNLNFSTRSLMVNNATKQVDGGALVDLLDVVTNNVILYLSVDMTGYVNVETGATQVFGNKLKVDAAYDNAGNQLALNNAAVAGLVADINAGTIIGYDVKAYRSNQNLRQRGQLLDTTYYNQIWAVPLRSPVAVLRPPTADTTNDSSDLTALVSATFARTSNEAVSTLLYTAGLLKDFVDSRIPGAVAPDLFGVARFLVEPTYIGEELDVALVINSVTSHEKAEDIQAVLAQKIRDIGYRLYRDSGFQAVVESKVAGVEGNPVILIGTDPMTARYLTVTGDTRLTGAGFDFKVVTSPDKRMEGKLVIALGYPGEGQGTLNPMHFGNMLWSPEATLVIPVTRDGQVSRELTVMPRFRHIVNVPIMGVVEVKNIPQVVSTKTNINFKNVP
jgi:hypothetical protein